VCYRMLTPIPGNSSKQKTYRHGSLSACLDDVKKELLLLIVRVGLCLGTILAVAAAVVGTMLVVIAAVMAREN
jgi:hypothetical protein